jgi:hypothetical protein
VPAETPPIVLVVDDPKVAVATPVLLLVQVPAGVAASVSVMVEPIQTEVAPVIAVGNTFTVTALVLKQPEDSM